MRTAILTAMFCAFTLATLSPASADTVEMFFQAENGEMHLSGWDLFASRPIKGKIGMSGFVLVVPGWAEGYAGPTYAPASWLELGLSGGVEQTDGGLGMRFASSVWTGYGKFSALGIVEFNPHSFTGDTSGVWFDLTPKYQLSPWFTLGAKWRRGVGAGPLVELSLPTKFSGTIWCSWMPVEPEVLARHADRFLLGVQSHF